MDYRTYQKLRAYCMQDLGLYINIPEYETTMRLWVKLHGEIGRIEREEQQAHSLFQCHDLTPREVAAAELLAVISNHRAITWQREPSPPNGRPPAPPLDASIADKLACQTHDAVVRYAAFLPEPEGAVLLADCEAVQAPCAATTVTTPSTGIGAVGWTLCRPTSFQGYGRPLFELLKIACNAGKVRPTARDVVEEWRVNKPPEVAQVLTDSIDYYDANGTTKSANLDAIRKAIGRMTAK